MAAWPESYKRLLELLTVLTGAGIRGMRGQMKEHIAGVFEIVPGGKALDII